MCLGPLGGVCESGAVMVQNGSFFYPKKVGFRPTAVYTAVLGDRDMKKYVQEPGGQQTLCLGT